MKIEHIEYTKAWLALKEMGVTVKSEGANHLLCFILGRFHVIYNDVTVKNVQSTINSFDNFKRRDKAANAMLHAYSFLKWLDPATATGAHKVVYKFNVGELE